eukprot:gnl/MRDRNA2_/MRDRNA2_29402_c0_seq1.p1 gnl/MRDRNA2_/MRDRNA2_29402_c0~~gnl/MRDRNA2_/MRDRNA2_29402_c0_seq1.p1  ORF type:complete len:920 (+),score=221.56 gnl/MRDRNA2_/MRDRNA2_29402_c0_seq1:106-2865(+)
MPPNVDYSKWKDLDDDSDVEYDENGNKKKKPSQADLEHQEYQKQAAEQNKQQHMMQVRDAKMKAATQAYEMRRPKTTIMHHYWMKSAGDPEAVGEYYQTGEFRNDAPVYRNQYDVTLSREAQTQKDENGQDVELMGWIIGNMNERRPLYGIQTDDLSVPTLGWQRFTAPEPLPVVRYYTNEVAAKLFKDRGNKAFQRKDYEDAEDWYSRALGTELDFEKHAEFIGVVQSNRAEVRLRMKKFTEALHDAERALDHFKKVDSEENKPLQEKTTVRRAKAFQALGRHTEALKILRPLAAATPDNKEVERLMEESDLTVRAEVKNPVAAGLPAKTQGAPPEMLAYMKNLIDTLQSECADAGSKIAEVTFPPELAAVLRKAGYLLSKAKMVEGEVLADLQKMLRASGGLLDLLRIIRAQWKEHIDGKKVNMAKLPGLCDVVTLIANACYECTENLKLAAFEAVGLCGALGGCNRETDIDVCEALMQLMNDLWKKCKPKSVEVLQQHSVVVERATTFMAKCLMVVMTDDIHGPDAPTVCHDARKNAIALLQSWIATGGRIEKRAVRGLEGQLCTASGDGLLISDDSHVWSLAMSTLKKVVSEPSLLSADDIESYLATIDRIIIEGPIAETDEEKMAAIEFDELNSSGAIMRYCDLELFENQDAGKQTALMLQAVASALDFRLLQKDRELGRDDYEAAFSRGRGWFILTPLIQGPPSLSVPAMHALGVLAKMSSENSLHLACLSGVSPLLGFPTPEPRPMPNYMERTLKESIEGRRHAARLLAETCDVEAVTECLRRGGEATVKLIMRLVMQIREDGKLSIQAFHDMLKVLSCTAKFAPEVLYRNIPEDILNVLVDLSQSAEDPKSFATRTLQSLMADPVAERRLLPIIRRAEEKAEAWSRGPDDELLEGNLDLHKAITPMVNQID